MLRDLVLKNRSYRRFHEERAISRETLVALVDLARLSPSGGNMQALRFILACDPAANGRIFPYLAWAGYLKEWGGPQAGERPSAYIVILHDKTIRANAGVEPGIAAQTMALGAVEQGLGACMLGAIQRDALRASLSIPEQYEIALVLALGAPAETIVLEQVGPEGEIKYWRDAAGVHHVPKRSLDDIIIG
jgi:nitroreductase